MGNKEHEASESPPPCCCYISVRSFHLVGAAPNCGRCVEAARMRMRMRQVHWACERVCELVRTGALALSCPSRCHWGRPTSLPLARQVADIGSGVRRRRQAAQLRPKCTLVLSVFGRDEDDEEDDERRRRFALCLPPPRSRSSAADPPRPSPRSRPWRRRQQRLATRLAKVADSGGLVEVAMREITLQPRDELLH